MGIYYISSCSKNSLKSSVSPPSNMAAKTDVSVSESEPLTASVRGSRLLGKGAEPGAGSGGSTSESKGQEEDDDAEEQARWSESRLSLSHSEEPLSTETRRSAPLRAAAPTAGSV